MRIIADEREKKSGIPKLLESIGLQVEVRTLPVGDYVVAPETVVERKSARDLLSSILDGRLYDQCARLRANFASPVLLLEGNVDELDGIVENPLVFYGAISNVALDYKIPIMPTPNAAHTARLLASMCGRRGAPSGPMLKKIKKSTDLGQQQLAVMCSLPGVGEKFAGRMLARFGTPLGALSATAAELAKVEGLGAARAKKIRAALDSKRPRRRKRTGQKTL